MIQSTNVDNIYFRNATTSLMFHLYENLYIEQVEDEKVIKYNVPVFYNKAQDSQFMRDYFTQYEDKCNPIEYADGDFDVSPFVIINLDSINIITSKMTSKFVRGVDIKTTYDENKFKIKKGYSACLFTLPIEVKYTMEIHVDDSIQCFRMVQSVLDCIYKNNVIHFPFKDCRCRANVAIDNTANLDKKISFKWDEEQEEVIKFSIVMECYYPIFDESTAIFRGDVIKNFRYFINGIEGSIPKESEII